MRCGTCTPRVSSLAQATASPCIQFMPFAYRTAQLARAISKPRYSTGESPPPLPWGGLSSFTSSPRSGQQSRAHSAAGASPALLHIPAAPSHHLQPAHHGDKWGGGGGDGLGGIRPGFLLLPRDPAGFLTCMERCRFSCLYGVDAEGVSDFLFLNKL